jgi:hypothetical protein
MKAEDSVGIGMGSADMWLSSIIVTIQLQFRFSSMFSGSECGLRHRFECRVSYHMLYTCGYFDD